MSAQDSPPNPPLFTPLDFGQFITTMSPDLDHEIKVIENLQITLMRRMFQGYRTMTENQWLQTQGKIISLNERKAQILDKQDPLPARMERRNVAEVYKWKMKFGRQLEALNQSREREESKAKKAKDKETARKVQEQGKGAQKKTKEEQKEQRKTKKENRRQKKQNQMETEKMERNQAEPTNDPPSTQVECCQTAAECLLKDHIECLFRLTININ